MPIAMLFPRTGTNQGENKLTAEEGSWCCRLKMTKFYKLDYRWEEKTRPFPKWVMFPKMNIVSNRSGRSMQIAIDRPLSKLTGFTYLVLRKFQLQNPLII